MVHHSGVPAGDPSRSRKAVEDHAEQDDGETTNVFRKQTLRVVLLSHLALTCSCAHQNIPDTQVYRRMQEHEAALARAQARLEKSAPCSDARAREVVAVCESGDALCAIGRTLEEADARTRWRRATDMCGAARAETGPSCLHCPQP